MRKRPAGAVRKRAEEARRVVESLCGRRPKRLFHHESGLTNFVFEALVGRDALIVRIAASPAKMDDFLKEEWVTARARAHGVPVARILELGIGAHGSPYMVQEKVDGTEPRDGALHPRVVRRMAEIAARVHEIGTRGFGHSFDWCGGAASATWREYLEKEMRVDERLDLLEKSGILRGPALRRLRRSVRELEGLRGRPSLNHGDLRLKNLIVDGRGKVLALVDWEHCVSSLAPYWDLSIALHDLSMDDKQLFLDAYGIPPARFAVMADAVKTLNVLHYAMKADRLLRGMDAAEKAALRLRLSGALDLYSL